MYLQTETRKFCHYLMYIFTALKEQPSSLSSLKKQQPVTTTLTVYLNQERSTASCKPNYA